MSEMSYRVGWDVGEALDDWCPDWSPELLGSGELCGWDGPLVEDDYCSSQEWLGRGPLSLFDSIGIKSDRVPDNGLYLRTAVDDADSIGTTWMDTKVDITEYVYDQTDPFNSLPSIDDLEEETAGSDIDQLPDGSQLLQNPPFHLESPSSPPRMYSSALLEELLKPPSTAAKLPIQRDIEEASPAAVEQDDDLLWILQNADDGSSTCLLMTGDDLANEEVATFDTEDIDDESLDQSFLASSSFSGSTSSDDDETEEFLDDDRRRPKFQRRISTPRRRNEPYRKRGTMLRTHRDRQTRKKEQNKNAATRYREKKKAEETLNEIMCEDLEKRNRELREQAEDMAQEIKVMKELIVDIFKRPSSN